MKKWKRIVQVTIITAMMAALSFGIYSCAGKQDLPGVDENISQIEEITTSAEEEAAAFEEVIADADSELLDAEAEVIGAEEDVVEAEEDVVAAESAEPTDLAVEPTEEEAEKEGFQTIKNFLDAWDGIYKKRGSGVEKHPYVWRIEFELLEEQN